MTPELASQDDESEGRVRALAEDQEDQRQLIEELREELADREKDLAYFRLQLSQANLRLEGLIDQLQQELRVAQALQKALVPTELPHIPGFELSSKFVPSLISGGDYFDVFEHENKFRFGVLMASSSGHSMSALFLSVLLKLTGRLEARQGAQPDKVLSQMIQELSPGLSDSSRADVFYGVVDRRSYELNYCRVGEGASLLQWSANGDIEVLQPCAGPIEPGFKDPLSSQSLSLNPRDRLVLCTRGILQAKNPDGEDFGLERLLKALREVGPAGSANGGVHDLRNNILYSVQKFSAGQELVRDMTVLVLEVKDRVIKLAKS